ncbi:hypothetical protein E2C01_037870 [Portunus trituberculatus]|uniref:Uncharacterized protein n=1 Tax=Portunus trituberculatus TaxID=210409 RepID=A0A5B7FIC6_PORTR|nr:hypothetical protein [Portunus trituberculatus]
MRVCHSEEQPAVCLETRPAACRCMDRLRLVRQRRGTYISFIVHQSTIGRANGPKNRGNMCGVRESSEVSCGPVREETCSPQDQ